MENSLAVHQKFKQSYHQSVQFLSCVWLFATHGLQHVRLPCPSPTPGAYSNSCPSSQLSYDPAIPLPHIYSKNWKHMVTQTFVYGWLQHNYLHRHASFYCVSIYCALWIMQVVEIESLWQLCWATLLAPLFFPSSICSFCASVSHFGNSHNISNPPRGRDYDSLEAQMRFRSFCPFSPTPVLLPGKSHGRRSLVGCSPWGR